MKLPHWSPPILQAGPSTIGVAIGKPIPPERYKGQDRDWILEDLHEALIVQHAAAEQLRRK
jgi:hypothetical protein